MKQTILFQVQFGTKQVHNEIAKLRLGRCKFKMNVSNSEWNSELGHSKFKMK